MTGMADAVDVQFGHPEHRDPGQKPLGSDNFGHAFQIADAVLQGQGDAAGLEEGRQMLGRGLGLVGFYAHQDQITGTDGRGCRG